MIPADIAFLSRRIHLYAIGAYLQFLLIASIIWLAIGIRFWGLVTLFEDGSFIFGPLHGCVPRAICALGG